MSTLATLVAVATGATSCPEYSGEVSYKPPFVPISVSINEKGELSVRFDASVVTPIGTFSLNVTPRYALDDDDGLLEILHNRFGEPVRSLFVVDQFGKGEAEMTVSGGEDVQKSGDQKKTTIEVEPGAQEFTIEVDDGDEVATPETTSVTTWSEPAPTTSSPDTPSSASTEPTVEPTG
jgi:hypothetical protein